MNRLTLYILRQSLGAALLITAGLTAIVWLIGSLKLVELIVNRGVGFWLFLELSVLSVPQVLALVLPIGMFFGILFTYNKLIADSEMVVMRACGLSQGALARPALILASGGFVVMLALSLYLLPASKNTFKDLQYKIRNEFTAVLLQEGMFNTVSDTLTVYVRSRDANGELVGLMIQDNRDPDRPVTMTAERGVIVQNAGAPRVLMLNGTRQIFDRRKQQLQVLTFDRNSIDLTELRDAPGIRQLQPDERYLTELFDPKDITGDPAFSLRLFAEGNHRLITPLYCMAYALVALACLLTGEMNRRGQTKRIMTAMVLIFLLQAGDFAFTNLANRNPGAIALMYLNSLAPIIAAALLLIGPGGWQALGIGPRRSA